MSRLEYSFLSGVILLGCLLRFVDLQLPDVMTDEGQFILGGTSNGHPPPAMWILRGSQILFGAHLLTVRSMTAIAGVLCLLPLFFIARRFMDRRGALLVTAVGGLIPSAIIFSRIAYLDVFLCLGWLLMLLTYLRADEQSSPLRLFILYIVFLLASFTKTQSFLFIGLLMAGRIVQLRGHVWRDPLLPVLFFSMIPLLLAVAMRLEILANIIGNTAKGTFGLTPMRGVVVLQMWWQTLGMALIVILVSLPWMRLFPWPVWMLLGVSAIMAFLFGPSHAYYATYLLVFALPVGMMLRRSPRILANGIIFALAVWALLFLGPQSLFPSPWRHSLFEAPGYWNVHADRINALLDGEETVTVYRTAGHQVRWYLEPEVRAGADMDPSDIHGTIVLLQKDQRDAFPDAELVYEDDTLQILRR